VPSFALALAISLSLGGCGRHQRPPLRPTDPVSIAAEQWPEARRTAQNLALAHDYAGADSLLRAFAARFPGTPAAAASVFWRALLRLDTAGDAATSAEAMRDVRTLLDAYVAGGPLQDHYTESVILRRVATRIDSLRASAETPRTVLVPMAPNVLAVRDSIIRARDDELTKLRAELESTKAELERIRRRIAPPRP
jgi:hypothetical protein